MHIINASVYVDFFLETLLEQRFINKYYFYEIFCIARFQHYILIKYYLSFCKNLKQKQDLFLIYSKTTIYLLKNNNRYNNKRINNRINYSD